MYIHLKLLNLTIMNLKAYDDVKPYRWGNTLKKWREPILNYSKITGPPMPSQRAATPR